MLSRELAQTTGRGLLRRAAKVGNKYVNPLPTAVGGLRVMGKILPLMLKNQGETTPRVPLGPFRTDAEVYESSPVSGMRITWMGHSTMLVEMDGVRVLIDPVWDERASPVGFAGPKRFFAAPLELEAMPALDAVLISHDHYDHLGESTVRLLAGSASTSRAVWVTSAGVGKILKRFGVARARIAELDWTESVTVRRRDLRGGIEVTALPTRHFSGRGIGNRFETLWSSFALKGPEHAVYYGADSGWWEGFAEIGVTHGPFDVTMLEIGAFHELWADIHLGPDGAVRAFEALGGPSHPGLLMPIHWELFDLALHGWRQPMERLLRLAEEKDLRLWSPEPGKPTDVFRGEEVRSDWWR